MNNNKSFRCRLEIWLAIMTYLVPPSESLLRVYFGQNVQCPGVFRCFFYWCCALLSSICPVIFVVGGACLDAHFCEDVRVRDLDKSDNLVSVSVSCPRGHWARQQGEEIRTTVASDLLRAPSIKLVPAESFAFTACSDSNKDLIRSNMP